MKGVFISDERNPNEPYVIIAEYGRLDIDPDRGYAIITLKNGSIHKRGAGKKSYEHITFDTNTLSIGLYDKFFSEGDIKRGKREMTLAELKSEAANLEAQGKTPNPLMNEYYQRFSIPFACLIFGILGPPLGLYSRRSGRSAGISFALAVFGIYYLMMEGGQNISSEGYLPPLLAVIAPNFFTGALGLYVLTRSAAERPVDPSGPLRLAKRYAYRLFKRRGEED
jgi:lipopolysaccharide export system permease protein